MTLVRAAAGTGKTRLAGSFAKVWAELTGGLVHVVTVSENAARVAAQEMENAGAPALSYNLARFLGKTNSGATVNPVQVGPRDVILLDEAGQVDTADLLKLQATADQAGARIMPVGDEYQLGAIYAGGMFRFWPTGSAPWKYTRCTGSPSSGRKTPRSSSATVTSRRLPTTRPAVGSTSGVRTRPGGTWFWTGSRPSARAGTR
jgi:hypothetical protein